MGVPSLSPTTTGWVIFIAALGMMAGLLAADVSRLQSWNECTSPPFIASILTHFSAVIAAFVAGKLQPSDPMPGGRRQSDPEAKGA